MKAFDKIFVNLSNHPSHLWVKEQREAAGENIIDFPFPNIDPRATRLDIGLMAINTYNAIMKEVGNGYVSDNITILVQGEMGFVYQMVEYLHLQGIMRVVHATSERLSEVMPSGDKLVTFKFIQFRLY